MTPRPAQPLPVSAPAVPAGAATVFGSRLDLAVGYAQLLATEGIRRGLIGPHEAERLWDRHLFNSVAPQALLPPGARVIDLGSGAGLPGIPLALARPDLRMVLLEPMERRAIFLRECVERLELSQVNVVRGRAEPGATEPGDAVVARAVARFDRLIPWARPLCRQPFRLLAIKGENVQADIDAARVHQPWMRLTRHDVTVAGATAVVVEVTSTAPRGTSV